MTKEAGELFPPATRVNYRKAPLYQVTCQLNFAPILRIELEIPAAFQDKVRAKFPNYHRTTVQLPPNVPQEVLNIMAIQGVLSGHTFETEDRSARLLLSNNTLNLTVSIYKAWEIFREQIFGPIDFLNEIYEPSFYTRIGLRYQNFISRSKISLANTSWSRLLRSEILGELADPIFEANALECRRSVRVMIPGQRGTLLLQHGFAQQLPDQEKGYLLDFDFASAEKTERSDAKRVLEDLHQESGRAFRWCITDELHRALDPEPFS